MINFNELSEKILNEKRDIVPDESSVVLIASIMVNRFDIVEIDFSKILEEDIITMRDDLFDIITDEDDDGNVKLDPNHPFCQVDALQYKMNGMEVAQKTRVSSPFRFL